VLYHRLKKSWLWCFSSRGFVH